MLWIWHAPPLYEAALRNDIIHVLEHALLLGTAFMFWSAARDRRSLGASVLCVFALSGEGCADAKRPTFAELGTSGL